MRNNVIITIICISIICFLQSCIKKYYYQEDNKSEEIIKAGNDKEAYITAYRKFKISETVRKEAKKVFSDTDVPKDFKLFNSQHVDITDQVIFDGKDSLEQELNNTISHYESPVFKSISNGSNLDTAGLYLSPVKIINSKFIEKEYSSFRDISLTYKNVSIKKISAIKFRWYGTTAFNEPADMGGSSNGGGGGFDDDGLNIGETTSSTWSINSRNGKRITIAYPYEVAFEDGTSWKLEK